MFYTAMFIITFYSQAPKCVCDIIYLYAWRNKEFIVVPLLGRNILILLD